MLWWRLNRADRPSWLNELAKVEGNRTLSGCQGRRPPAVDPGARPIRWRAGRSDPRSGREPGPAPTMASHRIGYAGSHAEPSGSPRASSSRMGPSERPALRWDGPGAARTGLAPPG